MTTLTHTFYRAPQRLEDDRCLLAERITFAVLALVLVLAGLFAASGPQAVAPVTEPAAPAFGWPI